MGKKSATKITKKTTQKTANIPRHLLIIEIMLAVCIGLMAAVFVQFIITKSASEQNDRVSTKTTNSEITEVVLPEFNIDLKDITLDTFRAGTKNDKYKGNTVSFTQNETTIFKNVEIKGRGNSTWGKPKVPFQLKFSETIDFLGLGAAKKWVFLANYFDDSNLRNDIAFKIANMLEEKYANKGEFVKVIINGEYQGIYYLTHKMEAKQGSVELQSDHGVLMEIDNLHRETEDCIVSKHDTCVTVQDTVADEDKSPELVKIATNEFMQDYNRFEDAVRSGDYSQVAKVIDTKSLAEYYIVSELSSNPDAYLSSLYFYKDGPDDLLHAGPVWDFDFAFANRKWKTERIEDFVFSPYSIVPQRNIMKGNWNIEEFYLLIEMPKFIEEIKAVFQEKLSGKGSELVTYVKERADMIRSEAEKDAEKWEIEDLKEDTDYLIDWVARRFEYFEYTYGK